MARWPWRLLCALPALVLGAGVLTAGVLTAAAGDARNRSLERLLGGAYGQGDVAMVQSAFASALRAGVRERDALEFVEPCVSGQFTAPLIARVLSISAQLQLEQLPLASVLAKVEEGVSKRVDPERIVQAAERRALGLAKAKVLINALVLQGLQVEDRDELLLDVAAALEAGRSPEKAREILAEALKEGESSGSIRKKLFP